MFPPTVLGSSYPPRVDWVKETLFSDLGSIYGSTDSRVRIRRFRWRPTTGATASANGDDSRTGYGSVELPFGGWNIACDQVSEI